MQPIRILAIETSCDETAAAVIESGSIASSVTRSQIGLHAAYGGVVPEIASRSHLELLPGAVDEAMGEAGLSFRDLDAVAVTYGPGLVGALLIGVSYAKSLAYAGGLRLIGVNHMAGHISAGFLCGAKPPLLCLVASGGHTMLVLAKGYSDFEVLGTTSDDAAGEALDKIGRTLGLEYPGGPKLDELAELGNEEAIAFPRPKLGEDNFDFSFSGLKSAALNALNASRQRGEGIALEDVCASFRRAVVDVLVEKAMRAARRYQIPNILACGGVACNRLLRRELAYRCEAAGYELTIPRPQLCSDNAAMIAAAAYYSYLNGEASGLSLNADPSLSL